MSKIRRYKSLNLNPIFRGENESSSQQQIQGPYTGSYNPHSRSHSQDVSPLQSQGLSNLRIGYQHQSRQQSRHRSQQRSHSHSRRHRSQQRSHSHSRRRRSQ